MGDGTIITWTLEGTYLVTGIATGYEYEPLPGAEVAVTNLRTNESAVVEAEEDGTYACDLGDATEFPAGYEQGDEILITLRHRDVERSWKRRVRDARIYQDAHMTHGTWKGAMRKAKLLVVDTFTNPSGIQLALRDAHTRSVLNVTRNGSDVEGWSFSRPSTIGLPEQASSSDVFEVERVIYRTPDQAKEEVVAEGDAQVRNAMARHYASPLPTRVPELQEISEALAAARMRDILFSGAEKPDMEAVSLRKFARDRLKELYEGTRQLTDQDGAFLTPNAKSVTVPRAKETRSRQQNPFTESNTRVDL